MTSRGWIVGLITFAAFVNVLAYSIAVPVLPDISARLGASPTVIGLLFASFGLTVLLTSVPMGTVSDRIGRRVPLIGGLVVLTVAAVIFAVADSLPWLFAARLAQGAADAVTWVVGLAVVADLYDTESAAARWARSWPAIQSASFWGRRLVAGSTKSADRACRTWSWRPWPR